MGIISAIIALLRAVPSLERLFLKVSDGIREAQAKERFDAKLTHIGLQLGKEYS